MLDRWTWIEASGALLVGGGVWALAGVAWACIVWGGMLLGVAGLRAWVLRARRAGGRSE